MANSKIKTLWTIAGRVYDSREVLDSNGGMLGGRVDIPQSMFVNHEGYTKVEYQTTRSDGSLQKVPSFEMWISSVQGTIESKRGSGVMTVFIDPEAGDIHGILRVDVYKEWDISDPVPESPDPIDGAVRLWQPTKNNASTIFMWEGYSSYSGNWEPRGWGHDMWGDTLINSFGRMSPERLGEVKAALGIEASGGGGAPAWERRVSTLEREMSEMNDRVALLEAALKKD